ncbi:MAG: phospholipid/cholesterol/gamma-HCH transport system substrate-binding protein [Mycobacterium sp.]|nr:phospholipid/cholesterol/gamma-HCH transport system substrate-binding protein [Mycobacterium sp.]
MLTRFVRIQLTIFAIASVIGVLAMAFFYMQVPTLLGVGKMKVTLELPAAGGLYRFGNVTYRGVEIGRVTSVQLTRDGARAELSLNTSPKVPKDLKASVRSVSAVGEQYVELLPNTDSGPFLENGSTIAQSRTSIPQDVGPMLDQVSALIGSIPKDKLSALLDESFKAFNGAGYDLESLADTSSKLVGDLDRVGDQNAALYRDSGPLLDAQAQTTDSIRVWGRSLAGFTDQLNKDDPKFRTVLAKAPGAFEETSGLLEQIKPTLPVLLANLTSLSQIFVTYHPALEQLLVLLPPSVAGIQAVAPSRNATGFAMGDFSITVNDPVPCTVGFLPPSQWRSPADTSSIDTPDNIYCKLPQDSPILVRGARNNPCMNKPGKRAPTVEICESDEPYRPLAMRQHTLGPYPFDPNLVAQNQPIDDRSTFQENIFAPIEGTPMPGAGIAPAPIAGPPGSPSAQPLAPQAANIPAPQAITPAPPDGTPHLAPIPAPASGPAPGPAGDPSPDVVPPDAAPQAAPSASGISAPAVSTAQYDPRTGRFITADGQLYQQSDLSSAPKTWQDMLPK